MVLLKDLWASFVVVKFGFSELLGFLNLPVCNNRVTIFVRDLDNQFFFINLDLFPDDKSLNDLVENTEQRNRMIALWVL